MTTSELVKELNRDAGWLSDRGDFSESSQLIEAADRLQIMQRLLAKVVSPAEAGASYSPESKFIAEIKEVIK